MPRDGWDAEAGRAVVNRNWPTQGALRLGARSAGFRPSDVGEKPEPPCPVGCMWPHGFGVCAGCPTPPGSPVVHGSDRLTPDAEGWYSLTIPGEPQVWERAGVKVITPKGNACPKCGKSDKKPIAMHYTPEATEAHETLVAAAWTAAGGPFLSGRLEAEFTFFQTPFKNGNLRGGDWDNFGKSISDALNNVAYPDDKYLRRVLVIKDVDEHNPRTVIRLRVMPEV